MYRVTNEPECVRYGAPAGRKSKGGRGAPLGFGACAGP
jgi:hypothetical protein